MRTEPTRLQGWGRFRASLATSVYPEDRAELAAGDFALERLIARGLGRSYGDAAQISRGTAVVTTAVSTIDWIDRTAGVIRADAGATIGQIIDRFAPKGWFVPVTPGTRQVTVGGAIVGDIHGKNHHVDGSFGSHVDSMRLRIADGSVLEVSPSQHPDLFWATVGGMGLTGVVVDADIRLQPIATTTVAVETQRFDSLPDLMSRMRASDADHVFSVAWVDLLGGGRSVLTQGSFASVDQLRERRVESAGGRHRRPTTPSISLPPVPLPRLAVRPALRVFNEAWFRRAPSDPRLTGESITAFFHPLDAISDWNRVYGQTGFVQWQCVVPNDETLLELADRLARLPAFFSVLKRFGPGNRSPLSFPQPGWTLAVDLPATATTLSGLHELDALVAADGGRIYLVKDARLSRDHFEQMYPRLDDFRTVRARVNPDRLFQSDLSIRLGL